MIPRTPDDWMSWAAERGREIVTAVAFSTRLPLARVVPAEASAADLAAAIWALPLAGVLVGAIGAVVYAVAHRLGVPAWPAAALTIAATLALTGCLHEDGLADTADGFGGGATRERKLEIMRDSRLGTYGGAALVLSLLLRAAVLAALTRESLTIGAAAMLLAGATSRACCLAPVALLDPARLDGAGASVGRLNAGAFWRGVGAAALIAAILGLAFLGLGRTLLAFALAWAAALTMVVLAQKQIGGQTGDVAGAAQQLAEIACLIGLLIGNGAA